jgi:hypothetical protein
MSIGEANLARKRAEPQTRLDRIGEELRLLDPAALTPAQIARLRKAEKKLRSPIKATRVAGREDIIKIQVEVAYRREVSERRRLQVETSVLAAARDEDIEVPAERLGEEQRPMRRLSGMDWLWSKGRVTEEQMAAGMKYGDVYRELTETSVPSALRTITGGHDITDTIVRRATAREDLSEARGALSDHPGMVDLCDRVCGEGDRLRIIAEGDDLKAAKLETALLIALDLLAKHYGIVTK